LRCKSAGVDEQRRSVGKTQEDRIALAHVEERRVQ
jgi:hypothetical protein